MKKAQLETMQTIFILIIVFVLISILLIFILFQQNSSNSETLDQYLVISNIKKSKTLALLPEMQYSSNNVIISDHYDKYALFSFKDIIEQNQIYYASLLGNVKLSVDEYDFEEGWKEVVLFDFSKEDYKGIKQFRVPVVLTEPDTYKKTIGVIYVDVYT